MSRTEHGKIKLLHRALLDSNFDFYGSSPKLSLCEIVCIKVLSHYLCQVCTACVTYKTKCILIALCGVAQRHDYSLSAFWGIQKHRGT